MGIEQHSTPVQRTPLQIGPPIRAYGVSLSMILVALLTTGIIGVVCDFFERGMLPQDERGEFALIVSLVMGGLMQSNLIAVTAAMFRDGSASRGKLLHFYQIEMLTSGAAVWLLYWAANQPDTVVNYTRACLLFTLSASVAAIITGLTYGGIEQ